LNDGFFEAAILMVSPVFGLRPVRAARSRTWKVPKPTRVTASPSFSALVMAATTADSAAGLGLGQVGGFSNGIDQFGLVHSVQLLWRWVPLIRQGSNRTRCAHGRHVETVRRSQ